MVTLTCPVPLPLPSHCSLCELGKEGITPALQTGGLRLKTEVALPQVTELISDDPGPPAF